MEAGGKCLTETDAMVFLLLLGIITAFPAVAREAIFITFATIGVPEEWLNAVIELYRANYHWILWRGKAYPDFFMEAWIAKVPKELRPDKSRTTGAVHGKK